MSEKQAVGVRVRVLMPGRVVADETADMVILKTSAGDKGVLPGHEPSYVELGIGLLRFKRGGVREDALIVAGGFATVANNTVTVLTPVADTPGQIEKVIASIAREREDNRLHEKMVNLELSRAEAALRHALVRREESAFAILRGQLGLGEEEVE